MRGMPLVLGCVLWYVGVSTGTVLRPWQYNIGIQDSVPQVTQAADSRRWAG